MAGLNDIVQKAFYLGVGIASYAGEKGRGKFGQIENSSPKISR